MGALLPNNRSWDVANWVARGFFEDARPLISSSNALGEDVQFCIDADLDTLDLREYEPALLSEFVSVVDKVIAMNVERNGSGFADPAAFPVYLAKLRELQAVVRDVLSERGS